MLRSAVLSIALALAPVLCAAAGAGARIPLDTGWRIQVGDDPSWATPDTDDTRWRGVDPDRPWELQGYEVYDGYAWYRIHFTLPSALRNESLLKDQIQIAVGLVDDSDQTFLNGSLIGQNGVSVPQGTTPAEPFEGGRATYRQRRVYRLGADDPRIRWDADNLIAIRVHDHGGAGGLYGGPRFVAMVDLDDVVQLDVDHAPFEILPGGRYRKTLRVRNDARLHDFAGELRVSAEAITAEGTPPAPLVDIRQSVHLRSGTTEVLPFELNLPRRVPHVAHYAFVERESGRIVAATQEVPYILTPDPAPAARINGPRILGMRPGSPFAFRIPVSGQRPLAITARDLPPGLTLDAQAGVIRGSLPARGRHEVTLEAHNAHGSDIRVLTLVVGDSLALTPPMTWNTWRRWALQVSDAKVREAADLLIESGLADHGWSYVAIDDGWQAPQRLSDGQIGASALFPDMTGLAESMHARGLRLGLFSSPGPRTCGDLPGAYGHEQEDAGLWSSWGIDLLEYGWCTYGEVTGDRRPEERKRPYVLMGSILERMGRDIIFSISQYGWAEVWKWADDAHAQIWHASADGDGDDTWQDVYESGFAKEVPESVVHPGSWRSPGMLDLGWLSWGNAARPTHLTVSEQYSQVSQWALLAAPLTLSCDLARLDELALGLLTNDEVLAVDLDPLGRPGRKVLDRGLLQVWVRPLEDGSRAVGVFNMDDAARTISLDWQDVGVTGPGRVRDLWRQQDLGPWQPVYAALLPPHGVALLRVSDAEWERE